MKTIVRYSTIWALFFLAFFVSAPSKAIGHSCEGSDAHWIKISLAIDQFVQENGATGKYGMYPAPDLCAFNVGIWFEGVYGNADTAAAPSEKSLPVSRWRMEGVLSYSWADEQYVPPSGGYRVHHAFFVHKERIDDIDYNWRVVEDTGREKSLFTALSAID
jgi:hypothetical protein